MQPCTRVYRLARTHREATLSRLVRSHARAARSGQERGSATPFASTLFVSAVRFGHSFSNPKWTETEISKPQFKNFTILEWSVSHGSTCQLRTVDVFSRCSKIRIDEKMLITED